MGLHIVAESILRLEHKVDALLRHLKVDAQPMHFLGVSCPVCHVPVEYTVDISAGVAVRRCDCKTGKIPATIPMLPVPTIGAPNGNPPQPAEGADSTPNRPSRKVR